MRKLFLFLALLIVGSTSFAQTTTKPPGAVDVSMKQMRVPTTDSLYLYSAATGKYYAIPTYGMILKNNKGYFTKAQVDSIHNLVTLETGIKLIPKTAWVADTAALKLFIRGGVNSVTVADPLTGGLFSYHATGYTANGGIVYPSQSGGFWVRSTTEVTPQMFGAKGDGVTDDIIPLRKWAYFIMNNNKLKPSIIGKFKTSSKLSFIAGASPANSIYASCQILPNFTAEDEVVRFEGWWEAEVAGNFTVICNGNSNWVSRTNGIGVKIYNCSKLNFNTLMIKYAKYDGVFVDNYGYNFGVTELVTNYCGSAISGDAVGKNVNVTANVNTGSQNSTAQRSTLTLSELPIGVNWPTTFIKVGTRLHQVMSVDAPNNKISVYPWIDSTLGMPQNIAIYMGSGFRVIGGDASNVKIAKFDALVCGIGLLNQALYPASVDMFTAQFCGVGSVLGLDNSGGHVGGYIGNGYFEHNDFDFVVATLFPDLNYSINTAGTLSLAKTFRIVPALDDNTLSPYYSKLDGVSISQLGKTLEVSNELERSFLNGTTEIRLTPPFTYHVNANTRTFTLNSSYGLQQNRLFGYQYFILYATGTGTSSSPTGTYTFTPQAGYSVNGGTLGANYTVSGMVGATVFYGKLEGTNWTILDAKMKIPTGTSSQYMGADNVVRSFGTKWGQTDNGSGNISGDMTGVGAFVASKTFAGVTGSLMDLTVTGSGLSSVVTGQKITAVGQATGTYGVSMTNGQEINVDAKFSAATGIKSTVTATTISGGTVRDYIAGQFISKGSKSASTAVSQQYIAVDAVADNLLGTGETSNVIAGRFQATGTSTTYGGYFSASGGSVNNWGLYSALGKNYFSGNMLINTLSDNGNKIQISGNGNIVGNFSASGSSTANSFIKTGGTATEILLANGGVLPTLTLTLTGTGAASYNSVTNTLNIPTPPTVTGTNTGDNATNTTSNAYADAKVANDMVSSTTVAPSKAAVIAAIAAITPPTVSSGTYTPTITGVSNFTSSSSSSAHYTRIGNQVTVTGFLVITATAVSVSTNFTISLPIASNLGSITVDLLGMGTFNQVGIPGTSGFIQAETTTDTASCYFTASPTVGSYNAYYSFTYTVI